MRDFVLKLLAIGLLIVCFSCKSVQIRCIYPNKPSAPLVVEEMKQRIRKPTPRDMVDLMEYLELLEAGYLI